MQRLPIEIFQKIIGYGGSRFSVDSVARLDGAVRVAEPDAVSWSAHEERQATARSLKALAGCLGSFTV